MRAGQMGRRGVRWPGLAAIGRQYDNSKNRPLYKRHVKLKHMSTEAKGICQHCEGHIAFPNELAGQTVECPHCKCDTFLVIPPPEN